ncbi:hypothetical protein C1N53_16425 [Pontibacter sp. SGAir0037]|nr:hypothetical protein C1N53_16425 [Pontibacter sp. SGAir0037]
MMKRVKALWSLLTCKEFLLVTLRPDIKNNSFHTKYIHNMKENEVKGMIAIMYCHTKSEDVLQMASELLAKSIIKN